VIEQLHGFWRQGQEAKFVAFARNAKLCFGKQRVVPIQSQYFGGPQSLQEHQAHDGQVARSAEARPETATSSTESGTMLRLGTCTRSRLIATRRDGGGWAAVGRRWRSALVGWRVLISADEDARASGLSSAHGAAGYPRREVWPRRGGPLLSSRPAKAHPGLSPQNKLA